MKKQTYLKPIRVFVSWPRQYKILGIFLVLLSAIATGWLWPRHIAFSYHQASCANQLVIAPGLYRSSSRDGFRVKAEGEVKLGGVSLLSTKTCVSPVAAPKEGVYRVNLSPFGWSPVGKTFNITIPKPPVASVKPLEKQLAATLPLKLALNSPDEVFSYKVAVDEKRLDCETNEKVIHCDIKKLSLSQGTKYTLALERYFNEKKVVTIAKTPIETLRAATVTGVSIKQGEMVFSKPKNAQLKLDKALTDAKVELIKIDDKGDRQPIAIESRIVGDIVDINWSEELPRRIGYELILKDVIAKDGSALAAPYIVPFKTSGGPKVTGISIGRTKVPIGATAVITFDQALSEKQDIQKAVSATGGAKVTGVKGNQVTVSTAGIPRCGAFTITVNDALVSGYDITGGSGWQYSARTACYTVGSIGTSVKGRSILAYYFGSGANHVVYTGAIHGDEVSTRSLMLRWIDDLEANPQNIPSDKTIVVVPVLNPDGYAKGTRVNANNVDLNRNFNVSDWKKDVTTVTNKPFPGGGGAAPMSEPETKAIANLVARLRPSLVLSYHSVAGIVAANLAGNSASLASSYAGMSGYRNATGSTASVFDYQITGTADDYFAEKLGVRSILIELGSQSYHQFERNQKAMWAMTKQ